MEEATHLKRNQFGTKSAIIFALVYTAPVMSLAGALQVMAGKVGYGVPMGMMVGALAMIATALSLMEMVKTKPHTAGSIGAFGKEALGPVWGFVPGWMILIINLNIIFPAPICAVYLHSTLEGFFGWSPPAWVMVIGIVSIAAYIAWRGIVPSLEAALVFFCVEMVIMGALAIPASSWPVSTAFSLTARPEHHAQGVVPRGLQGDRRGRALGGRLVLGLPLRGLRGRDHAR